MAVLVVGVVEVEEAEVAETEVNVAASAAAAAAATTDSWNGDFGKWIVRAGGALICSHLMMEGSHS